ncbi:hypothetical protein HDU96_004154 [Phlyctochytrium bullatum]|nr:hypothetical protein HDU96_004154 [Phlyctochytrium bullatum]
MTAPKPRRVRRRGTHLIAATAIVATVLPTIDAVPLHYGNPVLIKWTPKSTIQWDGCPLSVPSGVTCAKLTVPLDHLATNNSASIDLQLIKWAAHPSTKRKGAVVYVPGIHHSSPPPPPPSAPSSPPTTFITLDVRGLGFSSGIQCFPDAAQQAGFNLRYDLYATEGTPRSTYEVAELAAWKKVHAQGCLAKAKDLVRVMSTAYVARDLGALRVAMDTSDLDFWGTDASS